MPKEVEAQGKAEKRDCLSLRQRRERQRKNKQWKRSQCLEKTAFRRENAAKGRERDCLSLRAHDERVLDQRDRLAGFAGLPLVLPVPLHGGRVCLSALLLRGGGGRSTHHAPSPSVVGVDR